MKVFSKTKGIRYCAFCSSRRKIYAKKHVDLTNVLLVAVFSSCVGTSLWAWSDARALVIFFTGLSFCEAFLYIRWRFSIVCNLCGFDPVLYRKSPALAAGRVRIFYDKKTIQPGFLLSGSPLLEIYRHQLGTTRRNELISRKKQSAQPLSNLPVMRKSSGLQSQSESNNAV